MSQLGGNLEHLANLRATFARQGEFLDELTNQVRNQLSDTQWQGPAADRFREAWGSDFEPSLRRLQQALLEAADEVARRREALIQAGS